MKKFKRGHCLENGVTERMIHLEISEFVLIFYRTVEVWYCSTKGRYINFV